MCAQRRLKYACASKQSEQSLRCPRQNTWRTWLTAIIGNYPSDTYAKRRLRSACASVQSDQSLRCPNKDTWHSGPSCSKLTTSLVNDSLKFTSSDTQIC